jgi:hypothetical protein
MTVKVKGQGIGKGSNGHDLASIYRGCATGKTLFYEQYSGFFGILSIEELFTKE